MRASFTGVFVASIAIIACGQSSTSDIDPLGPDPENTNSDAGVTPPGPTGTNPPPPRDAGKDSEPGRDAGKDSGPPPPPPTCNSTPWQAGNFYRTGDIVSYQGS